MLWKLLLAACVSTVLRGALCSTASLRRANDGGGRCLYTFTVPSPAEHSCPEPAAVQELRRQGALQRTEMEALQTRLGLLEVLVSRLAGPGGAGGQGGGLEAAYSATMREKTELQRERDRLEAERQELQNRVDRLRQENSRLRLGQCAPIETPLQDPDQRPPDGSSLDYSSPRFQEFKSLSRLTAFSRVPLVGVHSRAQTPPRGGSDSTGCGELVWIGEPESHRKADSIAGKYGVWMQDPEPVPPYGPEMTWRLDAVGSAVRQLFGYEDFKQLSRGFPSKVLLLPESVESTGAVVYRGSLYYQRRKSRTLLRYDLRTESMATRRELPHAGFHGQYPYSWGGYTDIDLAVDETGLWAIYSTSKAKGAIVLSRLDPDSLEVLHSWETSVRKQSVANAFVICGTLYTVASYTTPNTTVNYSYSTESGHGRVLSIPFQNRYRYNSMIDYNPARRQLFSWDNYHMVTYDVRLGTV
ncbi:myocilin [Polyodon spathula]|uniref:myocilin n=1 Tax=Polyodon spathula TaxID=7913 RepID=UPI001B7E1885|nr:myocilin [Polyodon spathula]